MNQLHFKMFCEKPVKIKVCHNSTHIKCCNYQTFVCLPNRMTNHLSVVRDVTMGTVHYYSNHCKDMGSGSDDTCSSYKRTY